MCKLNHHPLRHPKTYQELRANCANSEFVRPKRTVSGGLPTALDDITRSDYNRCVPNTWKLNKKPKQWM